MLKKILKKFTNIRNPNDFFNILIYMFSIEKIRFLIIGGYNTLVSYIFGIFYFKFLEINFLKIIIFNIIVTIHSFISHKFLSFKKSQFSLKEIRRGFIVYSGVYLFSAGIILSLINFGYSQLFAYHINILLSIFIFYFLHSLYTFK